jgi:hypothetical protein
LEKVWLYLLLVQRATDAFPGVRMVAPNAYCFTLSTDDNPSREES